MKVILVNGSPHPNGCTATALAEVAGALNGCGVDTESFWIGARPISGCMACGQCGESGQCVFTDQVNLLAAKLDGCDGIVFGSPATALPTSLRLPW